MSTYGAYGVVGSLVSLVFGGVYRKISQGSTSAKMLGIEDEYGDAAAGAVQGVERSSHLPLQGVERSSPFPYLVFFIMIVAALVLVYRSTRKPRLAVEGGGGAPRRVANEGAGAGYGAQQILAEVQRIFAMAQGVTFKEFHFFPRGSEPASEITLKLTVNARVVKPERTTGTMQSAAVRWSLSAVCKIGLMVCGNSGQPGGEVGQTTVVKSYGPQEEDTLSAVLLGLFRCRSLEEAQTSVFKKVFKLFVQEFLLDKWGLNREQKDPNASDWHTTKQGVDYANAADAKVYGSVWLLDSVRIVGKDKVGPQGAFLCDEVSDQNIVLAFVSGPNAGASRTKSGTTARTLNNICDTGKHGMYQEGYDFLYWGTYWAIHAGLLGMIAQGCKVALVAPVSAGLYAGEYKNAGAENGFPWPRTLEIVEKILEENVPGKVHKIGQCFDTVLVFGS